MIAPTPILRAPIYDIHDGHLQQTLAESRQLCATPASTEPNDAQLAEAEASGGAPPSFRWLRSVWQRCLTRSCGRAGNRRASRGSEERESQGSSGDVTGEIIPARHRL